MMKIAWAIGCLGLAFWGGVNSQQILVFIESVMPPKTEQYLASAEQNLPRCSEVEPILKVALGRFKAAQIRASGQDTGIIDVEEMAKSIMPNATI